MSFCSTALKSFLLIQKRLPPLTQGCEGTWECQVNWHLSAFIVHSSPSVSHSGGMLAPLPGCTAATRWAIYRCMTQFSHLSTRQTPSAGDASAQMSTSRCLKWMSPTPALTSGSFCEAGLCIYFRLCICWQGNTRVVVEPEHRYTYVLGRRFNVRACLRVFPAILFLLLHY